MTMSHAVIWIDHQQAQVVQFDAEHVAASHVKASTHPTRQHNSAVRSEHEFFGHVCDALAGNLQVLVVGTHTAQDDFKHYVDKHRPETAKRVAGYETADYPTEGQLVAQGRQYFLKQDHLKQDHLKQDHLKQDHLKHNRPQQDHTSGTPPAS